MKILIIEDNIDHLELIADALHAIREIEMVTTSALTMTDGLAQLESGSFDVCFCDLKLPDSSIEQTVNQLSSHSFSIPIIVLSSINSLEIAKGLLNNGVQDFLPKDEISSQLLYRTCRYAIERWNRQHEIEEYNEYMQVFCSSLSHDFNGHISHIMTVLEILKDSLGKRVDFSESENSCFDLLTTSTSKVNQLVSDLQQYLSVEYSHKNLIPVELPDVINQVSESLKETIPKDFIIECKEDIPTIQGNPALLHLLFHNLLNNAIKFNENMPKITISYVVDGKYIQVSLQDNGIGIDSNYLEAIFSPFKRIANKNHYLGSGLGLSIVKRIVDNHNGSVEVTSTVGEGSCFTIRLLLDNSE